MTRHKLFIGLGIVIFVLNIVHFVPSLIKHDGMVLEDIKKYRDVEYAYGNGNTYGLFRKTETKYEKISNYAPLGKKFIFFLGDKVYYTARTLKIVELNLVTLEDVVYDDEGNNLLLGLNDQYFVLTDSMDKSVTKIIKRDKFKLVKEIEMQVTVVKVDNNVVEFIDNKSLKHYIYCIDIDKLIEK